MGAEDLGFERGVVEAGGPGNGMEDGPRGAAPVAPATTCPVCQSPVAAGGFCMNCWDVC